MNTHSHDRPPAARIHPSPQRGVVLIISLIMLVVISMLAAFSIRNAASTESVAGNARTTMLATQAAEMGLKYCENSLVQRSTGIGSITTALAPTLSFQISARWTTLSNWDSSPSDAFVVPLSVINESGVTTPAYKREPECMIEPLTATTTRTFVVTARGFGPEEAGGNFSRPNGSEVWMQSTIELN